MKTKIFVVVLLLGAIQSVQAQNFVLLDRRWTKPVILTDSVTRANLSDGWYPIYRSELDTLVLLVEKLRNLKDDGLSRKFYYSQDFKTEHLEFVIENIKRAYGDGYEINLISKGPFGQNTLKLSDPRLNLPENQKVIRSFLHYLLRTKKQLEKTAKS
jgi:hypothetical protein